MFRIVPPSSTRTLRRRASSLVACAVTLVSALALVTGCSTVPGDVTASAPTVTATITAPTTITTANTVTAIDTVTTTATERLTDTVSSTLTPKPAGTTTIVHTTTKVRTAVTTVTAPPPKPKVAFSDGSYVVGKDVAPGIYQASDPNPPDGLCYWETDSRDGEIIDNGVNDGIVHVTSSVFSFLVRDCGDWTKVG